MLVLQVDGEHRQVTQGSNSHAQQFHVVSQGETNNVDWTKKISIQCESQIRTQASTNQDANPNTKHTQYKINTTNANRKVRTRKKNATTNQIEIRVDSKCYTNKKTRKNTNTNAVPTGYQQRKGFLEKRGDNN